MYSIVFSWSPVYEIRLMYWNLLTIKNKSACCRKLDAKDLILDIFAEGREFLHFIITSYEYFESYILFDKLKLILV